MLQILHWPVGNGQVVPFEQYVLGATFSKVPGVYIMCRQGSGGRWHAVYVGQTHDLDARVGSGLINHHALAEARVYGATHICVQRYDLAADRNVIESTLCRVLQPPVNKKLVA